MMSTYVLDNWVWFWDIDVIGHMDFLVLWNMDGFVVWHWNWDFLDDSQSLLFMMMVVRLFMVVLLFFVMVLWHFMVDLVTEGLALVAVAASEVMTSEVMFVQAAFVLLFARFCLGFDGLLFLVLSLFFSRNA